MIEGPFTLEDAAPQVEKRPRRAAWLVLAWTSFVLAVLAALITVAILFALPYVRLSASELPPGHPHSGIFQTETSFTCASVVGYAWGDRDPLCQGPVRVAAALAVGSFGVTVGLALLARWGWRRARAARARSEGMAVEPKGRVSTRRGLLTAMAVLGAVVVVFAAGTVVLGPNGGRWAQERTPPPTIPGLGEWKGRLQPLLSDLGDSAGALNASVGSSPGEMHLDCRSLVETAAKLEASVLPAPDPELDELVRRAVERTNEAADACTAAAGSQDVYAALDVSLKLASATIRWTDVADRYLLLKIGPG